MGMKKKMGGYFGQKNLKMDEKLTALGFRGLCLIKIYLGGFLKYGY